MLEYLICSIISSDRVGLIDEVATCITSCDGNWLESNMSKLSGQFAGIISICITKEKKKNLIKELNKLKKKDIIINISDEGIIRESTSVHIMDQNDIHINVLGSDRPGIIQNISHALNVSNINILNMQTSLISAPMSAEKLFNAEIIIQRGMLSDFDKLQQSLNEISEKLLVSIDLKIREN